MFASTMLIQMQLIKQGVFTLFSGVKNHYTRWFRSVISGSSLSILHHISREEMPKFPLCDTQGLY
jgi:hypothetical protein